MIQLIQSSYGNILFSVALNPALDIQDIIPPVNIVKPTVNVPTVSVPTSSWKPDQWATWPFITITGVSGKHAALQHSLQIPQLRGFSYIETLKCSILTGS